MIKGKAENVSIPKNSYDLIFTSPPYFDLEVFTDDKNTYQNELISYKLDFARIVSCIL